MGLFDSLKNALQSTVQSTVKSTARQAVNNLGQQAQNAVQSKLNTKTETIVIAKLPETVEEMQAMPEATLDTPFKTAALVVCALCAYTKDREAGTAMLNFLRGPRPMQPSDVQFLNNRFMDGQQYIPFSFFEGATPDNDYTPAEPLTLKVEAGPYAYQEENYASLHLRSGGADSPREVKLRKKGDGQWMLWDQLLLAGIRQPKSQDPWA